MDAPTSPSSAEPAPDLARAEPGPGETSHRVRIVAWGKGKTERLEGTAALAKVLADEECRVWVDVTASEDAEVREVARLLDLHPLIAEDIAERNQRAKVTEVGGTIHLVMFWIAYEGSVTELEVDIVLDHRSLLTVHDAGWEPTSMNQLRGDVGNLLKRGPDFLLYAITDGIVDGYFPVLDAIEDEIDRLQDDVIKTPTPATLERLFELKKELIGLRRAMSPAREIFNQLTNRDLGLVQPDHVLYFRDVYDHLIRVTDELDNDRELVGGTLEVYLSTINNNLSTIMKRLTGVTVILAGIGAVAGVFGMSEATTAISNGEGAGFWLIAAIIVVGAAITAVVLRRIDWI